MKKIVVRGQFDFDPDANSNATGLLCLDETLTVQAEKEECDINVIMRRFGVTGQLPSGVRVPTYGDFTDVFDFQSAHNALLAARDSFMAMPAEVRARFANDPGLFVDFCSDPANLPEMRRLGLAVPEPKEDDSVSSGSKRGDGDVKSAGKNVGASSRAPGKGAPGDEGAAARGEAAAE